MKKNKQFSLLLATIFFLIAFSGLIDAVTISENTQLSPNDIKNVDIVKVGDNLYAVDIQKDGSGINQVELFKSTNGGLNWVNYSSTKWVTSSITNKIEPQLLSLNDGGLLSIFYFKVGSSILFYKLFDGVNLGVENQIIDCLYYAVTKSPSDDTFSVICKDSLSAYLFNYIRINYTSSSEIVRSVYATCGQLSFVDMKSLSIAEYSPSELWVACSGSASYSILSKSIDGGFNFSEVIRKNGLYGDFVRVFVKKDGKVLFLYSEQGTGNVYGVYYGNREYGGTWYNMSSFISNKASLVMNKSNLFEYNGSVYFAYVNEDYGIDLGYWLSGTTLLNKRSLTNDTNFYFATARGSNYPLSNNVNVTTTIVVAKSNNSIIQTGYNLTSYSLNMNTFAFSGAGGEEQGDGIPQGGGSGYFCAFYRYYFDWLNLNDYCLFADSFDYSRNVSLSAYLNGVDYFVLNGTLASSNGWNYSTSCDISNHPVPSYFSQSIKDSAGGITEGSDICQNISYYEGAITRTFDVPTELQNKGIFKMVARVILEPLKGAKAIIEIGKSIPSQNLMATGTILVIGINDSNGNAFIWYSDGNNWLRASNNAKCDLYFSNTSQYSSFEVRLDLNTKTFDISSVGSVYCDRNFSAPNSAVIGSGLSMFENPMNYLDEVRWYINPDIYGNPEEMTPTFPYLYDVGLSDLVISKVLGDSTLETCSYGVIVQDRCNCGNEVAEIGQWCCYEYNTTSFWIFNQYDAQYCGGVGICRTNVRSEDICLCNGQYNYGRWCCYSVANGYYIGDFNSTFCGGGAIIGGGDNITITPYTNSTIGDSFASLLGLNSPNLKIVATLLFLIAGIFVLVISMISSKIEGTALILIPSLFVVLGIIFFFVIGWIPFWILFILVILCAGIFGLFIKSTFGSSSGD